MRSLVFLYGIVGYVASMGSLLLLIGFCTDLVVPNSLGASTDTFSPDALLIDVGLIALFGLQHTVTARQGFKSALTKIIPEAAERTTYCIVTAVLIGIIVMYWQPLPGMLWHVEAGNAAYALTGIALAGWGFLAFSSFLVDHFDLFGLRQVWFYWKAEPYRPVPMKSPALYKWLRHPMMLGILIGVWSTPQMTMGHLVFAAGMTAYILIGIWYEEKDLVRTHGDDYQRYRDQTPALIPRPPAKKS